MKHRVAHHVQKVKGRVKGQSLSQDSWLLALLAINALVIVVLAFWSLTHIRPTELSVPIRFTSFTNFDALGRWYQLYEILGISLVVFAVNTVLAYVAHPSSRLISALLLLVSLQVSVVGVAMIVGFTAINFGGV